MMSFAVMVARTVAVPTGGCSRFDAGLDVPRAMSVEKSCVQGWGTERVFVRSGHTVKSIEKRWHKVVAFCPQGQAMKNLPGWDAGLAIEMPWSALETDGGAMLGGDERMGDVGDRLEIRRTCSGWKI